MAAHPKHIKVLYLVRWYPNRYDPMPGLFIQRHAEAAGMCCDVGVVYTHVAEEKISGFELVFETINGVPTAKVYYSYAGKNIPGLSSLIRGCRFFKANAIGIRKIRKELGAFDLIHVHILTRLGLIALWYKWFRKKPFVISEHWSRYLPLTGDFKGILRKWMTKVVVKNAAAVTTVTQNLAGAMQNYGLKNNHYRVLPNVVTKDFLEHPVAINLKKEKTTFVHVSCFEDRSKNISGLLRVIRSMSEKRNDFVFKLVGEGMDLERLKKYAGELGLNEKTAQFTGLLEGKKLVEVMAGADLMVVFSNYENFPVVINESFALGVPVIATRVGGIPEFVNDGNGRLLDAGDERALEKYLTDYIDGKLCFDSERIREQAHKNFAPEKIGQELCVMYKNILLSK